MFLPKIRDRRSPGHRLPTTYSVRVRWTAQDKAEAKTETTGSIINVSPSGALVSLECLPSIGTQVTLILEGYAGSNVPPAPTQIAIEARVVRVGHTAHSPVAALELDFTKGEAQAQMRHWMDEVYEPIALASLLDIVSKRTCPSPKLMKAALMSIA